MHISYKNLWITCAHHEISRTNLRKLTGLSPATFTKLRRNQEVSLSVLMRIAEVLKCDISDIVNFVPEAILKPLEEDKQDN